MALACAVQAVATGASARPSQGRTFRVALPVITVDSIDPVLSGLIGSGIVLRAACASLLTSPPKRPPDGYRLVPDLAAGQPKVSKNGRTYTFTIRRGRRFGVTGRAVTARDVAQTLNRALDRRLNTPEPNDHAERLIAIRGARDVLAGRRARAGGIVVRGSSLVLRLARRPRPDFLRYAGGLCVLPAGLPVEREGLRAPLPTAGPYTITSYSPGRRVVLRRNRFYTGPFPGRLGGIDVTLTDEGSILERVERGEFDWGFVANSVIGREAPRLVERYGVNRSRFFITRGLFVRLLVLNTARPLFRDNARLRRAVNFAIERNTLLKLRGYRAGTLTDQYLSPAVPGFRDAHVYPLRRPDLRRARMLARGRTRARKAVFYGGDPGDRPVGEIVRRSLEPLGIDVEVKLWPGRVVFDKLATPGEPFDIGRVGWLSPPDPALLNNLFDGRTIGKGINWSYFNSPRYNRALARVAGLTGQARYRAYGALDVELAREAAPAVAYAVDNDMTLVGPRVPRRCVVVSFPSLDLRAACLR